MTVEFSRPELVTAIGEAMREYQRGVDAIDQAVADRLGVNRTDLRVLDELFDGPRSAGELATRVGLSPAAMTTAVDRLESKGHARRVRDSADRRKVLVELTEQTRRVLWEAMGPIVADGERLLGDFTEAELARINAFVRAACELNDRNVARLRG